MSLYFRKLPWERTAADHPRRIGLELEMAGLESGVMAAAVQGEFGGRIVVESPFVCRVCATEFGDFQVELDARVLKDRRFRDHLESLGLELSGESREALEQWLAEVAGWLVPHEIVTPPLPLAALPRLDRVRAALQRAGAQGTQSSLLYAFGLQINIEAHDLGAPWLTRILQAFLLLNDALVKAGNIDLSRQLSPYIRPFPGAYARLILQPGYRPEIGVLIDDYLEHNPTRNRPLDLLPIFAQLDRERVWAAPVERELIKPRPALHYRLPNCEINDPAWSLAHPFNGWAEVEELAADLQRLRAAAAQYLERPEQALGQLTDQWSRRIRAWF